MVKVLGLTEVHQVLVVDEDLDGEGRSVEVMSPGLQGMNNGKELPVIDVIILLCGDKQLEEVGAGVPFAI